MKKIYKVLISVFLLAAVFVLSSCDEEGKGKAYFDDTTWKGTWAGTGTSTESCDITLTFNSDTTGKISFDFTTSEDFSVNFTWGAWLNNNNNDIPYVLITFDVSDELTKAIIQVIEIPFSPITSIDAANKKSDYLSTNFTCDLLQYVGEKYLGYTHKSGGINSTVYEWNTVQNGDITSSTRTGSHFPKFKKQ